MLWLIKRSAYLIYEWSLRYFNVENKLLDLRKALESRQDYIDNIQTENYISKDLIMSMRSHGLFAHRGSLQG